MIIQHENTNTVLTEQDLIDIYMEGYNEGIQSVEEKYEPTLTDKVFYHRKIAKEVLEKSRGKSTKDILKEFDKKMDKEGNKRVAIMSGLGAGLTAYAAHKSKDPNVGMINGSLTGGAMTGAISKAGEMVYKKYTRNKLKNKLLKQRPSIPVKVNYNNDANDY